jgi:NADH-ubiquinone oxidoreductase chain 1
VPTAGNATIYALSPIAAIFLVLVVWRLAPLARQPLALRYSGLLLLVILRLNLYPLLLAGWSSNRKYAFIGAVRGVAQTISYEIRLAMLLLRFLRVRARCEVAGWLAES